MVQLSFTGMIAVLWGAAPHVEPTHPTLDGIADQPYIELWTSSEVLRRGDRAYVWFRTDTDAYVTVLRIDTDGRVRVLFPYQPWQDNLVPGGYRMEISEEPRGYGSHAFIVDDYPGQGYVFAIASLEPFDYRRVSRGDLWDYHAIGFRGEVTNDPYVAVMDIIDEIAFDPYGVSYDVYPYYVERRYEYPRFLCYDCHEHVPYAQWDPYRYSCVRFRIVVHDDPYYYPTRVYRGSRVVYTRPHRVEPRYVFKDREPGVAYVTRASRPRDDDARRRAPAAREGDRLRVRSPDRASPSARGAQVGQGGRALDALRRQLRPVPKAPASETRRRTVQPDTNRVLPKPKLERRTPARRSATPSKATTPTRRPVVKPSTPRGSSANRGQQPKTRDRQSSSARTKPQVKRRKP